MKLTKLALQKIDVTEIRLQLALTLGFTEAWIIQLISKNKENGPLTTAASLDVIRKATNLEDDELLEKANSSVAA